MAKAGRLRVQGQHGLQSLNLSLKTKQQKKINASHTVYLFIYFGSAEDQTQRFVHAKRQAFYH
jgi:hypothetical protein